MYDKYILFGYPLRFSFSPPIHQAFAAQFGLQIEYEICAVKPENFQTCWEAFFANGGKGANVTTPYKEIVYSQLKNLTVTAKLARAVNTVVLQEDGKLLGANTDGVGLIKDFSQHNINVTQRHILILGAGGAVRGILPALLALHPARITIANRNLQKAQLLIKDFSNLGSIDSISYAQISLANPDIIINATSVDLQQSILATINFKNVICYDLNYASISGFIQTAKANGAQQVFNGFGMLVEQAAAAFKLWQRLVPDTSLITVATTGASFFSASVKE